jgi:hypothetical protein
MVVPARSASPHAAPPGISEEVSRHFIAPTSEVGRARSQGHLWRRPVSLSLVSTDIDCEPLISYIVILFAVALAYSHRSKGTAAREGFSVDHRSLVGPRTCEPSARPGALVPGGR